MKIFIGSAREASDDLKRIASWIKSFGHTPLSWNDGKVFLPGMHLFTKLVDLAHSVDAAIFLFSEDDEVKYRSDTVLQPRDNVMIEYGLFLGALGPQRVIFCRKGRPKTASDLHGIIDVDVSEGSHDEAKRQLRSWIKAVAEQDSTTMVALRAPESQQSTKAVHIGDSRGDVCTIGHREYVDLVERLDPEHRLDHSPLFLVLLSLEPGSCKQVRHTLIHCQNFPPDLTIEGVYDVFGPYDILVRLRAPNWDYTGVQKWLLEYLGGRNLLGELTSGRYKYEPTLIDVSHEFCRVRKKENFTSEVPRGITAFIRITRLENDAEVFRVFERCKSIKIKHGPAAQITGVYLAHNQLVAQFYLTCGGYYDLAKVVYALESDLQEVCRHTADRVTLLAMYAWEAS